MRLFSDEGIGCDAKVISNNNEELANTLRMLKKQQRTMKGKCDDASDSVETLKQEIADSSVVISNEQRVQKGLSDDMADLSAKLGGFVGDANKEYSACRKQTEEDFERWFAKCTSSDALCGADDAVRVRKAEYKALSELKCIFESYDHGETSARSACTSNITSDHLGIDKPDVPSKLDDFAYTDIHLVPQTVPPREPQHQQKQCPSSRSKVSAIVTSPECPGWCPSPTRQLI